MLTFAFFLGLLLFVPGSIGGLENPVSKQEFDYFCKAFAALLEYWGASHDGICTELPVEFDPDTGGILAQIHCQMYSLSNRRFSRFQLMKVLPPGKASPLPADIATNLPHLIALYVAT